MKKIVIVGAGASGVVCAIKAKNSNNEVILLEKNSEPLKKILVTGNGRCNYFNDDQNIKHYHSDDDSLIDEIINDDNTKLVKEFFDSIGVVPKIKGGYYYPYSNQAVAIKSVLMQELNKKGIKLITDFNVKEIRKENDKFIIKSHDSEVIADSIVISTGSKAAPKTGSSGDGYLFASNFNHTIVDVLPGLTQLKANENYFKLWSGIRCDAKVSLYEDDMFIKDEVGEIQLIDYGVSGIVIFNLSSFISRGLNKNKKEEIVIDFLPVLNLKSSYELRKWIDGRVKKIGNKRLSELFDGVLNYKLVSAVLKKINLKPDRYYNSLTDSEKNLLSENIHSLKINIDGVNSFEKSQVCSGGVKLSELNLKTFESKLVNNLYFIGEIVDIDGDCGGYNLTFAFLSGIKVGESLND